MLDVGEVTRVLAANSFAPPVRTKSNEEARAIVCRRYKNHTMQVAGDGSDFDFLHASAPTATGSFNILRYGAGVVIDPGDFDDFYMLEMPLAGGVELHFDGRVRVSGMQHGLIISPGRPLTSVWRPGTVQMMLKIDKKFMLHRLRGLTERPIRQHPIFEPLIDLDRPEGWRLANLMALLAQDFMRSVTRDGWSFERSPLAAAAVDALLTGMEHDQRSEMGTAAPDILPRHVRRCVLFIHENYASEITAAQLAQVAGTSERTLYEGFRAFLDMSPQQYLVDRRLRAARELLAAGSHSVAAVARMCGFRHQSRFARMYRDRYLEYPSQTQRL